MIQTVSDPSAAVDLVELLIELRRRFADANDIDPHSTLERLPSAEHLLPAFQGRYPALVARASSGEVGGYGLTWTWLEDDGTRVYLLDVWAGWQPDPSWPGAPRGWRFWIRVDPRAQSSLPSAGLNPLPQSTGRKSLADTFRTASQRVGAAEKAFVQAAKTWSAEISGAEDQ